MDIALDPFFNIFRVILEMAESSVLSGSAGHVTYMTTLILTKRIHNFCHSLIEMEGPPVIEFIPSVAQVLFHGR